MYDIIVIGAGPAGLTASLYALRSGKSVLIFEKETIGGQIATSPKVENYPGYNLISGLELADKFVAQAMDLNVMFEFDTVKEIVKNEKTFVSNSLVTLPKNLHSLECRMLCSTFSLKSFHHLKAYKTAR